MYINHMKHVSSKLVAYKTNFASKSAINISTLSRSFKIGIKMSMTRHKYQEFDDVSWKRWRIWLRVTKRGVQVDVILGIVQF